MFGAGVCPACGQHVRQGEVVHFSSCSDRAPAPVVERLRRRDAAASCFQTTVAAAETLRRRTRRLLLRQQRRCGVALADCCCGSRDVAASHSQTAVAAAKTLQRHILRLLLRQLRRVASGITAETAVEPAYFAMAGRWCSLAFGRWSDLCTEAATRGASVLALDPD